MPAYVNNVSPCVCVPHWPFGDWSRLFPRIPMLTNYTAEPKSRFLFMWDAREATRTRRLLGSKVEQSKWVTGRFG